VIKMINTEFEAYKIKREIKRSGRSFTFKRNETNDYGEPSGSEKDIYTISGLYHEETSRISITTGETTSYRSKKLPKILCLYSDISNSEIKVGDFTIINGIKNKVTGIENIQAWNLISDISLEVEDNGI
jgi:hypothetical protein